MKLSQAQSRVWSICGNNPVCGICRWMIQCPEDSKRLTMFITKPSPDRISTQRYLFPWSLTLITWDLLILKFMKLPNQICFISKRVLDFCPGNALFQNIWGCLALASTDIIVTASIPSNPIQFNPIQPNPIQSNPSVHLSLCCIQGFFLAATSTGEI